MLCRLKCSNRAAGAATAKLSHRAVALEAAQQTCESSKPKIEHLPSPKLAEAIEQCVAAATARVEKLTQAILAKEFRGELVPTEAELARREGRDYESASPLLERIRAVREVEANNKPARRKPRERRFSLSDSCEQWFFFARCFAVQTVSRQASPDAVACSR
jgi:hypothetical protein